MYIVKVAGCVLLLAGISGCMSPKVTCSGNDAVSLVRQIILDDAEKALLDFKKIDGTPVYERALVISVLKKVAISVEDIRTSNSNQNTSKVACEGNISIVVPHELLTQAEEGRDLAKLGSLTIVAKTSALTQKLNTFTRSVEYYVQPTADGKKVYASVLSPQPITEFLTELVGSLALKPVVEAKKAELIKAEQAEQVQLQKNERLTALLQDKNPSAELDAMLLAGAKEENLRFRKAIEELWDSIPVTESNLMIASHKAWIKKKNQDCKTAFTSKATNEVQRETSQLLCDSVAIGLRMTEMQQQRK